MLKRANRIAACVALAAALLTGCHHKYENPIAKQTEQPDKVLFDRAISELEHNRFASARLLFNTLINTYESSEFLAKANLAVADSWYREGDTHGLAQAEAAYKDFILFYPTMEESAEAQERVCQIHYDQMEKPDRDSQHAILAEQECRNVLTQYPNSKFAPQAEQLLRNIQENLAMGEYRVATFYMTKGNSVAAANRFTAIPNQFPLFSQADEAAWRSYESWNRLGDRFEKQQIEVLSTIVSEYPLSLHAEPAKARLQEMKAPVPEPNPEAEARMKYELANRNRIGLWSKFWGGFSMHPNLSQAAKSGAPSMEGFQPTTPVSVPPVGSTALPSGEVTVSNPAEGADSATPPAAGQPTPASSTTPSAPKKK
jgi:outer membrane protein assembly factor BamD